MKWLLATTLACAAGCQGQEGTIELDLTTAPGSTLLASVRHLRLTLPAHGVVRDTTQGASGGFDLSLAFSADGEVDRIVLEGFDDGENLIATGSSPPFVIAPTQARIAIYVAPPLSIGAAPVLLSRPRSDISGAALPYGAVFTGGFDAGGPPVDTLAIYNDYDHTLATGQNNPIPRANFAIGVTSLNGIVMIGGVGTGGTPVSTIQVFDTTVQPAGAYVTAADAPTFARAGEILVPTGSDHFLLSGSPPAEYAGREIVARADIATLPNVGASVLPSDGVRTAVFVGESGLVRFRANAFDTLVAPGRQRAAITDLPATGKLVVAGGGTATVPTPDVLLVDPITGAVEVHANALATPRYSPGLAATTRYVVVVGGTDAAGAPIATAEIFDATTLAPITVLPVAARARPLAFRMSNGQVLIGGGSPASDLLELFQPPP